MSVSFAVHKTLHGSLDERFIQLKGVPHKILSSDPDISWSPGLCKESVINPVKLTENMFDDSLKPLSVQVGSNQYWAFETGWGLFEFPNTKVSDIIEKKLINKYGLKNILTHKYTYNSGSKDKAFLLVLRTAALITVYSTIILASKLSRDFIDTEKLYIGVNNDENMTENIITDNGRKKHYCLFPIELKKVSEIFDLKNKEDLFRIKNSEHKYNCQDIKGIESAKHQTMDGKFTDSIVLDNEYSLKFGQIISGRLDKISREDMGFFSNFKKTIQKYIDKGIDISLSSTNVKGEETKHSLSDIIKKVEEAESKILKLG